MYRKIDASGYDSSAVDLIESGAHLISVDHVHGYEIDMLIAKSADFFLHDDRRCIIFSA
jgi:hypothetical protein